ncbi:unnamed protein product, partial [Meganyctiphanes norvegica]
LLASRIAIRMLGLCTVVSVIVCTARLVVVEAEVSTLATTITQPSSNHQPTHKPYQDLVLSLSNLQVSCTDQQALKSQVEIMVAQNEKSSIQAEKISLQADTLSLYIEKLSSQSKMNYKQIEDITKRVQSLSIQSDDLTSKSLSMYKQANKMSVQTDDLSNQTKEVKQQMNNMSEEAHSLFRQLHDVSNNIYQESGVMYNQTVFLANQTDKMSEQATKLTQQGDILYKFAHHIALNTNTILNQSDKISRRMYAQSDSMIEKMEEQVHKLSNYTVDMRAETRSISEVISHQTVIMTNQTERFSEEAEKVSRQVDTLSQHVDNYTHIEESVNNRVNILEEKLDAVTDLIKEVLEHNNRKKCIYPYTPVGDQCLVAIQQKKTWDEAEQFCQKYKGHLAQILDWDALVEFLRMIKGDSGNQYWMGGSDALVEGVWRWIGGDPVVTNHWGNGEPNNAGDEHCMELYHLTHLNDLPCHREFGFICQQ